MRINEKGELEIETKLFGEGMMTQREWKEEFMRRFKLEYARLPDDLKACACRNVLSDMDCEPNIIIEKMLIELKREGRYIFGSQTFYGWLGKN